MMRFKLVIEYDGTEYHGWQVQPNGRTVQAVLEEAIFRMRGERVRVTAAGRTDAGVHACGQVISFVLQRPTTPDALWHGLNALTPRDVSIRATEVAADDFDARRGARSRMYAYRIWNAPWASPFWRRYAWHIRRTLDPARMRVAAAHVLGEHDFSSFQGADSDAAKPVRRVLGSELEAVDCLITYTIEATGFLRHMVRNIAGTLVEIGMGERNPDDLPRLLAARDRTQAGPTAPACGLCLTQVKYD